MKFVELQIDAARLMARMFAPLQATTAPPQRIDALGTTWVVERWGPVPLPATHTPVLLDPVGYMDYTHVPGTPLKNAYRYVYLVQRVELHLVKVSAVGNQAPAASDLWKVGLDVHVRVRFDSVQAPATTATLVPTIDRVFVAGTKQDVASAVPSVAAAVQGLAGTALKPMVIPLDGFTRAFGARVVGAEVMGTASGKRLVMRFQLGSQVAQRAAAEREWTSFFEVPGPDAQPHLDWALLLGRDLMVPHVRHTMRVALEKHFQIERAVTAAWAEVGSITCTAGLEHSGALRSEPSGDELESNEGPFDLGAGGKRLVFAYQKDDVGPGGITLVSSLKGVVDAATLAADLNAQAAANGGLAAKYVKFEADDGELVMHALHDGEISGLGGELPRILGDDFNDSHVFQLSTLWGEPATVDVSLSATVTLHMHNGEPGVRVQADPDVSEWDLVAAMAGPVVALTIGLGAVGAIFGAIIGAIGGAVAAGAVGAAIGAGLGATLGVAGTIALAGWNDRDLLPTPNLPGFWRLGEFDWFQPLPVRLPDLPALKGMSVEEVVQLTGVMGVAGRLPPVVSEQRSVKVTAPDRVGWWWDNPCGIAKIVARPRIDVAASHPDVLVYGAEVLDDPHGQYKLEVLTSAHGGAPVTLPARWSDIEILVRVAHPLLPGFAAAPYPCRVMIWTVAGVRCVQLEAPPAMAPEDVAQMRANLERVRPEVCFTYVPVRERDRVRLPVSDPPEWKRFPQRWQDAALLDLWTVVAGGFAPGAPLRATWGGREVGRLQADARGWVRASVPVAPGNEGDAFEIEGKLVMPEDADRFAARRTRLVERSRIPVGRGFTLTTTDQGPALLTTDAAGQPVHWSLARLEEPEATRLEAPTPVRLDGAARDVVRAEVASSEVLDQLRSVARSLLHPKGGRRLGEADPAAPPEVQQLGRVVAVRSGHTVGIYTMVASTDHRSPAAEVLDRRG